MGQVLGRVVWTQCPECEKEAERKAEADQAAEQETRPLPSHYFTMGKKVSSNRISTSCTILAIKFYCALPLVLGK